jgi:glycosyltransferase involved in cell wall biosynthesis
MSRPILIINRGLPVPPVLGGAVATLIESYHSKTELDTHCLSVWHAAVGRSQAGYHHVNIDKEYNRLMSALNGKMPVGLEEPGRLRRFCYQSGISDVIAEIEPSLLVVHNGPEYILYLSKMHPEIPIVLVLHNSLRGLKGEVPSPPESLRAIVSVSSNLESQSVSGIPTFSALSQVIRNGIDVDFWNQPNSVRVRDLSSSLGIKDAPVVIFVGRVRQIKGPDILVKAMRLVRQEHPQARLLMIGTPTFLAQTESPYMTQVRESFDAKDTALGYVPNEELRDYLALADLVAVPSQFKDPLPTVVLEAMAANVPVVGSAIGGIPEMIETNKTGLLVEDHAAPAAWATAISEILGSPSKARAMAAAARRRVTSEFNAKSWVKKYDACFNSVIESVT